MSQSPTPNEQFYLVVLCQGARADGEAYWAYLKLHPLKAKAFKAAQKQGTFQLEEFGEIIEWGLGEAVPTDVMARMEREHRVSHQFEAQLREGVYAKSSIKKDPTSKH